MPTAQKHVSDARPVAVLDDALLRSVLDEVRRVMTPQNYARWFAPTRVLRIQDTDLVIGVPTPGHAHWLDIRLRHRVEEAMRQAGHGDLRVRFEVTP